MATRFKLGGESIVKPYLYADGTRSLSGNWNAGAFSIESKQTAGTAATIYEGFKLTNSTTASSGNQMYSPIVHWSGQGWKTTATAASQAVDFRSYVIPIQGAAAPTGNLTFESSIAGGAYTANILNINSAGFVGVGILPTQKFHVSLGASQIATFSDGSNISAIWTLNHGFLSQNSTAQISSRSSLISFFHDGTVNTMTAGTEFMRSTGNNLAIGAFTATAFLHIRAGTATAGTAPLKLTAGTNLTVVENGAFEYDGTNLYFSTGGVRKTVTLV